MGKKPCHQPKLRKKFHPLVSVCTPTFNRRPFIETMFQLFRNQTYPKDRMEWIIVDDGTDPIEDLVQASNIPQIQYIRVEKKLPLGAKRNLMHSYCKGTIIVYMDDDDYYPPERVEHAVDTLTANRDAMCAGSSEIYVFFKNYTDKITRKTSDRMVQCGPYGPKHSTAGTFAFRTELLKTSRYEEHAALAEEKHFLKNYTVPFVQLDPLKTILVFSHEHNTFDKRKLLENPHPEYLKDSPKTVDMFIRRPFEAPIKEFFLSKIDGLLAAYAPGEPAMKPDVLEQIKVIEAERAKQVAEANAANMPKIMLNRSDGGPPVELTQQQLVDMLNQQNTELAKLREQNAQLQNIIQQLQQQKIGMPAPEGRSKSDPEILLPRPEHL